MSIADQAGLVVLVGLAKAPDAATLDLISRQHIGGVVLTGPFKTGTSGVRAVVKQVDPRGRLLVATIQEGGAEQPLSGTGFDKVPAPSRQVDTPPIQLQGQWSDWGAQLARAGVRLNLAPPGDVLSKKLASSGSQAAAWDRIYGADPEEAAQAVRSTVIGLQQGGVAAAVTHFPGLGALGGPDPIEGKPATDTTTKLDGPTSSTYKAAMATGAAGVSVSTATYAKIDKARPAVYSRTVLTAVRSGGFSGAVVSDDLAVSRLAGVAAADRVLRFIVAGGDLAYVSDPKIADAAVTGLARRAKADKAVAARLADASANVLGLRAKGGLGACQVIQG